MLQGNVYTITLAITCKSSSAKVWLGHSFTNGNGNLVISSATVKPPNAISLPTSGRVRLIVDLVDGIAQCIENGESMQICTLDTNIVFISKRTDLYIELMNTRCWVSRQGTLYLRTNKLNGTINALPASLFRELISFL
jgi:hypothetical protein